MMVQWMKKLRVHKCPICRRLVDDLNELCSACYSRTPAGKKFEETLRRLQK